jgi:hypothetical protein
MIIKDIHAEFYYNSISHLKKAQNVYFLFKDAFYFKREREITKNTCVDFDEIDNPCQVSRTFDKPITRY